MTSVITSCPLGPATSENVNVPSTEPCGMPPFWVESAERANTA